MGLLNFGKKKKKATISDLEHNNIETNADECDCDGKSDSPNCANYSDSPDDGLNVLLEKLPSIKNADNLVEIKDPLILARINSLVPSLSSAAVCAGNTIGELGQKDALFKVFLDGAPIRNGDVLTNSRTISGAKRAMVHGYNENLDRVAITKNANLIESKRGVDKRAAAANASSSILNVATMVVGQYYMQEINSKIGLLSDNLAKVAEAIELQYKSQVASLLESVFCITKYQMSSMEQDEVRCRELDNLQQLRKTAQTLLHHAEAQTDLLAASDSKSFDDYAEKVKNIEKWRQYQTILVKGLYQINLLDFTLHLGNKKVEHCFGSFDLHADKLKQLYIRLSEWHRQQCEKLKIDVNEQKRMHTGVLGLLKKPISLINDEWNYTAVDKETVGLIKEHTLELEEICYSADNPFEERVELILMNGKNYYLHCSKDKRADE